MTAKLDRRLLFTRILLSLLLIAAGILAVRAFGTIAPARILMENTVVGGMDALPSITHCLLTYEWPLRLLAVALCVSGLSGVWLSRKIAWILPTAPPCAIILLLTPPAIKFIVDQAFVPISMKGGYSNQKS